MAAYRIVFHDRTGEPVAESLVEQPDDDGAVTRARNHSHPYILQVWRDERFVASLPPRPERF